MRKVIEFEDATYQALVQLGRDRMATLQELADEAFDDVLKKHGVPRDLKDALRKSAKAAKPTQSKSARKQPMKRK
jgi:non-homologous end joining protein Ku